LEPNTQTSPDAFIQEQQKKRAAQVKRTFLVLGLLCAAAIVIAVVLTLSSKKKNETPGTEPAELAQQYSNAEQEAAREAFKVALRAFDDDIAPTLKELRNAQWQEAQLDGIEKANSRALALFANAGFVQALGILNKTTADSQALIEQWHQAFANKLQEASSFYNSGQVQKARLALAQADKIKPNHEQSQTLRAQLAAYENVQQYLEQLKVAKVENNLEKQVALMQSIIAADPTRGDIKQPLQQALSKLNQKRLALALSKAQQALAKNDISEANTYIQQAQIINPNAQGIAALRAELDKKVAAQGLDALHQRIANLIENDAWAQALKATEQGLASYPKDAQLLLARERSTQILAAQRRFESFISRSQRLSDSAIRGAAENSIASAIPLLPASASLATSAQTLAALIDKYSASVEVTVLSDSETFISVIGTGVVGKVNEKTISLSPGKYTLEGKREGFRSKRLDIEVKSGTPMTVSLVSDESL
jgi:hypothetical protein